MVGNSVKTISRESVSQVVTAPVQIATAENSRESQDSLS